MDAAKLKALVAVEKIPKKEFVKWIEAAGQHWLSGEIGQIPVFQAYCECCLRLPAHPFVTLVLKHFGVELVNLVPNYITLWVCLFTRVRPTWGFRSTWSCSSISTG